MDLKKKITKTSRTEFCEFAGYKINTQNPSHVCILTMNMWKLKYDFRGAWVAQ